MTPADWPSLNDQAALADRLFGPRGAARPGRDPERLLIGTIDGLNPASRRSAERAGRKAVLDYLFVPL
ncbi:hypothetical protein E2L08_15940 [Palleronia sediminis]|uniref:Uncharacterized protein n=1 Tax=Palleronia sediminis TaxID=2547833 RepID=A0A4R5ZX51_9RHOB|nr:hypothetical protein [Palleronia sediminis]TDL74835.1 hypothetical protein E2L08_15940 [Palleronia sediminis]